MNLRLQKLFTFAMLLFSSLSMFATHYINNTGKTIIVTNNSAKKRARKKPLASICFITIENGQEGDLDNNQGDEITIISPPMSDKRKLFPTNNSFNYVITLNRYGAKFERFDINHAGNEEEMAPNQNHKKNMKKQKAKRKASKIQKNENSNE